MRATVVGAGPAGLGAAYEFCNQGMPCQVLEKDEMIGGLSRTEAHNGYRFDIGGHRFYDKLQEVTDIWLGMLGDDWLTRPRRSKIFYGNRFFHYPLRPADAILGLGIGRGVRAVLSYVAARVAAPPADRSFEDWIVSRFGRQLFEAFFKTYTEKVWGISCRELSAQMAAARIKGFSLGSALLQTLGLSRNSARSSSDTFYYPRLGPGMLWDIFAEEIEDKGGMLTLRHQVNSLHMRDGKVVELSLAGPNGLSTIPVERVVSTMPLRELVSALRPEPPPDVLDAARQLRYRDFMMVALICRQAEPFPDTWIYVHDPNVRMGRVQNFKSWSPAMVSDDETTCIGVEYFCWRGDELWTMPDDSVVELAANECHQLGLIDPATVEEGVVVRMPYAYPIYDIGFQDNTAIIAEYIERIPNLEVAGRNGMHRYYTQDESMLAGFLAARRLLGASEVSQWSIDTEEY